MTPMPDRVRIKEGAKERDRTVEDFLRIPLEQQLELLMRGQVTFFAGQAQLRTVDALKVLREQRAAAMRAKVAPA